MCILFFKLGSFETIPLSGSNTYSMHTDYKGRKCCAISMKEDGMYKGYDYGDVAKYRASVGM